MTGRVAALLFGFTLVLSFILAPRIGVSWDEPDNIFAAGTYINFFSHRFDPKILASREAIASVFHENIYTQEPSLFRYPPVPLYIGALGTLVAQRFIVTLTSQQIITIFHIASGLFWALFVSTLFLFARRYRFSVFTSIFTAVAGGFAPLTFGYGLSTIKDSAELSLFTLSLYLLVSSTLTQQRRWFLAGCVVWGLALATKMNAIYVPIIWLVWQFGSKLLEEKQTGRRFLLLLRREIERGITRGVVLGLIGLATMVVVWPYLWFDPVGRLKAVFDYFTYVGTGYRVFWDGQIYTVGAGVALPWYPISHLIISTPLPLLVFFLIGVLLLIGQSFRGVKNSRSIVILILLWIITPLIRTLSPSAAFYDGSRHFLEIIPPIFLAIGWGFESIYHLFQQKNYRVLWQCIGIAAVLQVLVIDIMFFPFSTGYVNAFIKKPNMRMDRDFSGLAVREGVELAHKLHPLSANFFVPIAGHLSWYYLTGGDVYVYDFNQADVLILINKSSHIPKALFDTQIVGSFRQAGVIERGTNEFAWVYIRK